MAIRLEATPGRVAVSLTGFSALLALRKRLEVPADRITAVQVMPRHDVPRGPGTWLRSPGTHLPGLLRYGSYGRKPHRQFWGVRRQAEVLVIEAEGWDFSRIVLGLADPGAAAGEIRLAGGAR